MSLLCCVLVACADAASNDKPRDASVSSAAGSGAGSGSAGQDAIGDDAAVSSIDGGTVGDSGASPAEDAGTQTDAGDSTGWWKPKPGTSWQWQLTGTLDTTFDVEVYDIDLFETTKAQITSLHAQGRKVICYFDTAYEPYRDDSKQLEPYRGNPIDGWPGQFWLDIREATVVSVMKARIAMAKDKGCDGIEADDVDSRSNDPGFPITAEQQRGFIRTLAEDAHASGLAFGLKNALEDVDALVDIADFSVNEQCFEYDECDALSPFIDADKAVFEVEYTDGDLATKGADICPKANALNFDSLIKRLDLDPPRYSCR